MTVGTKQRSFSLALARLIIHAYYLGYELSMGDAFRDPRAFGSFGEQKGYGAASSVHKLRLAQDLNLFVGGLYVTDGTHPAWNELHDFWESIGGAERVRGDSNHFSFEHDGHR